MTYLVEFDTEANRDLEAHIEAGNKILIRKIDRLIGELRQHPKIGTGKPHRLRYNDNEIWSRRIDDRHRMLYTIDEGIVTVFVISLWGHYDDK